MTEFSPQLQFVDKNNLTGILQRVEKPGRYAGGEFGIPKKTADQSVRFLLTYPDVYELGMSNQGLKILYDRINRNENMLADRLFLPWPDFANLLREESLSLYSLDHHLTVSSFDVWGFNISHELHFTNLLYALDLANVPLHREKRMQSEPLIMLGGTAVTNPLPLFDFADCIFLGDGEEAIVEAGRIIQKCKENKRSRCELLKELSAIDGMLIPSLYHVDHEGIASGPIVKKRNYFADSFSDFEHLVLPNLEITQDRVVLEVSRGCSQGCRFCHAGTWKKPVRNIKPAALLAAAHHLIKKTGSDSISLNSLSLADYPYLKELVTLLSNDFSEKGISLSLPSLRIDKNTIPALLITSGIRRSSVTFALEAGSDLMRSRIHKFVSEKSLHQFIGGLFERGWDLVKIYFMLGLPDPEGTEVNDLIRALNELGFIAKKHGNRKNINVTISLFVPKPFTTFQKEKFKNEDYFMQAIYRVKNELRSRRVSIKYTDPFMATLESLLSRSDVRMGKYIEEAYRKGASFDSWDDRLRRDIWRDVLASIPEDILKLWTGPFAADAILPWEKIVHGFPRSWFQKDYEKFLCTEDVSTQTNEELSQQELTDDVFAVPPSKKIPEECYRCVCHLKVSYKKSGSMIYISHLDTSDVLRKALRRAGVPMTFSSGFNKHERMHFEEPLPAYIHSEIEIFYVELWKNIDLTKLMNDLAAELPAGITLTGLDYVNKRPPMHAPVYTFRLEFYDQDLFSTVEIKMKSMPERFSYDKPDHKRKGCIKHMERRLQSAIGDIHFVHSSVSFSIEHTTTEAISLSDFIVYYLNIPVKDWNMKVKIIRTGKK